MGKVNYVIFGKNLATPVDVQNDSQLAAFFDMLECRSIGNNFFDGFFMDGTIPLRVGILDQWDIIAYNKMKASVFYLIDERLIPNDVQQKISTFKELCERNKDNFDTSVYTMATKGAELAEYRATKPTNDKTKYPDYFGQFRNVAKKHAEESDSDYEFRLLLNFRLMFRHIQKNTSNKE